MMSGSEKRRAARIVKQLMLTRRDEVSGLTIYGKTGFGVVDGAPADAWFVGMYEEEGRTTYFAVRLDDPKNKAVTSDKAKKIALAIIADRKSIGLP